MLAGIYENEIPGPEMDCSLNRPPPGGGARSGVWARLHAGAGGGGARACGGGRWENVNP